MRKPAVPSRVAILAVTAVMVAALIVVALVRTPLGSGGEPNGNETETAPQADPAAEVREPDRYVALGDSFVSGPGIRPQRPGACARSKANFASLVADRLEVADFVDASCGSATTQHLFTPQRRGAAVINAPQLDALAADTTLITFGTLGGNDMGLVGLATFCIVNDCGPGRNSVDGALGDDAALAGIDDARANLAAGLREAKERAPRAEIHVIGYGTYLPPGGCAGLPGIGPAEADYLQGLIDRLSDMLAEVAAEEEVGFVDMREIPGAGEHTVCAEPARQWIRALATFGDGTMFHPSACGMEASAQHLLNAIREHRGQSLVEFDDSCVSAGPAPERQ